MILIDETFDKNYINSINSFIEKYKKSDRDFIFKTSGSTGIKKEINVTKTQLFASAKSTIDFLKLTNTDTALLCLNFDFVAAKMMIIRAINAGMKLIVAKPDADLGTIIKKYSITFAAFVPLQIEKIIDENGVELLNNIKNIIVGGASVSEKLITKLQNSSSTIYQTFGMTETVSHIAMRKINEKNTKKYYTILPNIEIKTNAEGCLCIKGDVTKNSWIETTDIVQLIDNQNFGWMGRKDFVINTGGIKINPEEIETKISSIINCNFIISDLKDEKLGQKIVLVLESKKEGYDEKLIIEKINQKLTKYEIPKLILYLDAFPISDNGKTNRLAIKKLITNQY